MERNNRQVRTAPIKFETRADGENLYIEGYFAVFNSYYEMWEGAAEQILPGAFKMTLGDDIRALINHDSRLVLGRTRAGTLSLREDEKGLYGVVKINRDDMDAMNLYTRVQRGDVDQCSIGFEIKEEVLEELSDGTILWSIKEAKLYEVSVVTFPAYEETGVEARKRDFEQLQSRKTEAWRESMRKKLKGE